MQSKDGVNSKLPLSVLLAYGAPGLPAALLGLPLLLYLPTYYAGNLGLGFKVVGAILLLARIWDVIADPLVGWASDRFGARFGRRRSWLLAAAPLVLVSTWLLFRPPADVSPLYLLVWALAAYLGWTMMTIPHQAWGAELTADYSERNRVMAVREGFGLIGVMAAAAAPTLLHLAGAIGPDEDEVAVTLSTLAWAIIVLLPLSGAWLLIRVPEPRRVRPPAALDWRAGARLIAGNAPFRRLLIAYLFNGVANGLPTTLFLLFVAHVLALPESTGLFLLCYFVTGVLGMPLWLKIARRHGKHRTWAWAMLYNCVVFALVPALGPGDMVAYLAVCLSTGLALGADLLLPPSMQADVVDVDTEAGGDQRTALYFAIWGMATKLAQALAVGIAFPLLDLLGFSASPDSETARFGLVALYAGAPVIFKLIAVALVWNFPLDAAVQEALRRKIDAAG